MYSGTCHSERSVTAPFFSRKSCSFDFRPRRAVEESLSAKRHKRDSSLRSERHRNLWIASRALAATKTEAYNIRHPERAGRRTCSCKRRRGEREIRFGFVPQELTQGMRYAE